MAIIQWGEKNRGHQKIGIVKHLYNGKDKIILVPKLRIGKKLIDRRIQLLYPLELYCGGIATTNNPSATEFCRKRTAAEIAKWWLKDIVIEDDDGDI